MDNPANFHDEVGASAGNKSNGYLCRQSSARWIPTVDQIRILRELYYSYGVRSPSAEQIQHISAKLRQYGKIEGKNVFYWFQNHKARERQKKRLTSDNHHLHHHHHHQHLSNTAAQSSLLGEKSYRGCCISGGEGAEAGLGWFGLETALPWTAYHCPAIGEPEMMNPAGPAVRTVETLPLFPVRAQDEDGEEEQEVQNFSTAGFQHCLRGGGGGTSLELSLNSYCYESPSSM